MFRSKRDRPKQIFIVQNNTELNKVFMNGLGNVLDDQDN
jgi:hypothetical protein